MDCTGCLWRYDHSGTLYCVMRDLASVDENNNLTFPKTPNGGCNQKTRVAVNSEGTEIAIVGAQNFIPLPGGYAWES